MVQEISFTGRSQNCCICFIDLVDSTRNTVIIDAEKMKRYYSIFINIMSVIARNFNSNIIKSIGDSIIYYFPETSDSANISAFKHVLECGLTMIAVNPIINEKLNEEGLPSIDYRISADYGRVDVAKSLTSTSEDLFGPTVNICAKINSIASPNSMVIGGDLYEIVKRVLLIKTIISVKWLNIQLVILAFNIRYIPYQIRVKPAMPRRLLSIKIFSKSTLQQ